MLMYTHMQHFENGDTLTGAAATALPVVHCGVEALEVGCQSEG